MAHRRRPSEDSQASSSSSSTRRSRQVDVTPRGGGRGRRNNALRESSLIIEPETGRALVNVAERRRYLISHHLCPWCGRVRTHERWYGVTRPRNVPGEVDHGVCVSCRDQQERERDVPLTAPRPRPTNGRGSRNASTTSSDGRWSRNTSTSSTTSTSSSNASLFLDSTSSLASATEEDCRRDANHALDLLHERRDDPVSVAACLRGLSRSDDVVGPSNDDRDGKLLCRILKASQLTAERFVRDDVGVVVAACALLRALATHRDLRTSGAAALLARLSRAFPRRPEVRRDACATLREMVERQGLAKEVAESRPSRPLREMLADDATPPDDETAEAALLVLSAVADVSDDDADATATAACANEWLRRATTTTTSVARATGRTPSPSTALRKRLRSIPKALDVLDQLSRRRGDDEVFRHSPAIVVDCLRLVNENTGTNNNNNNSTSTTTVNTDCDDDDGALSQYDLLALKTRCVSTLLTLAAHTTFLNDHNDATDVVGETLRQASVALKSSRNMNPSDPSFRDYADLERLVFELGNRLLETNNCDNKHSMNAFAEMLKNAVLSIYHHSHTKPPSSPQHTSPVLEDDDPSIPVLVQALDLLRRVVVSTQHNTSTEHARTELLSSCLLRAPSHPGLVRSTLRAMRAVLRSPEQAEDLLRRGIVRRLVSVLDTVGRDDRDARAEALGLLSDVLRGVPSPRGDAVDADHVAAVVAATAEADDVGSRTTGAEAAALLGAPPGLLATVATETMRRFPYDEDAQRRGCVLLADLRANGGGGATTTEEEERTTEALLAAIDRHADACADAVTRYFSAR